MGAAAFFSVQCAFQNRFRKEKGFRESIVFINGGAFVIEPAGSRAKFLYFREAEEQSFFIAFDAERFL